MNRIRFKKLMIIEIVIGAVILLISYRLNDADNQDLFKGLGLGLLIGGLIQAIIFNFKSDSQTERIK